MPIGKIKMGKIRPKPKPSIGKPGIGKPAPKPLPGKGRRTVKPIKKAIEVLSQQMKEFTVGPAKKADAFTQTAARNRLKGGQKGPGKVGKIAR